MTIIIVIILIENVCREANPVFDRMDISNLKNKTNLKKKQ